MIKRVLVIGGYGNFGSFISKTLAKEANIRVIVAGRSGAKAQKFVSTIHARNQPETAVLDIHGDLPARLKAINPQIVVHTCGPFQRQDYAVAEACIEQGIHYADLADGRNFVDGITQLDHAARHGGALIISGASSVPCLTAALVDHYKAQFKVLESLDYGITTAQKTARGLATTAAILGYAGKPFKTKIDGKAQMVHGWQGLHQREYKNLGKRLLGYCDIPDLALFPKRYPELQTIRFYAGLEIPVIHYTLWLLSWMVRLKIVHRLDKTASLLLRLSFLFDRWGSENSALHMELKGKNKDNEDQKITFELTARSGDGPYIPCMPAILVTRKLSSGSLNECGAYPCIGLITRDEYLTALSELDITWQEF